MGQTLTPDEAYGLQTEVVSQVAGQRSTWVALAGCLAEFHSGMGWKALGIETFNEWMAQPEISLSRGDAYAMIAAWRELVVEREVPVEHLGRLDVTKVGVILRAIREGRVEVEEALSDCEALSRSDLRAKYQSKEAAEYRRCEACGQRVKVAS